MASYLIPLPGGKTVTVSGDFFPLTAAEWDHFTQVLSAMKPGLVRQDGDYDHAWGGD